MRKLFTLLFWGFVIAFGAGTILNLQKIQKPNLPAQQASVAEIAGEEKNPVVNYGINAGIPFHAPIEPIEDFYARITKKPFSLYITPQNSPVQPDRFKGYHTGVDIEYEDIIREIPVKAISQGMVVFSKWASGYGGVIVIRHNINEKSVFVVYGHLDPATMLPHRTEVTAGEIIGFLGEGKTEETDGARKHLHFAILKKNSLDIRGYVQSEEELNEGWYDPLEFYNSSKSPNPL